MIYRGSTWTATANPFETAPVHLHQLLSPYLDRMGAAENDGFGCATTLASTGHAPTAAATLFTYPADGTRGWRASEIDREGPFTPAETAGIPQGTRTGPTLYVLVSGPGIWWGSRSQVLAASVSGPAGPVPLLSFDSTSPQVGRYLPAGAQLLPRDPLAPASTYTATLRLLVDRTDGTASTLTRTWSFTTAAAGTPAGSGPTPAPARPLAERERCTVRLRYAGLGRIAGGARRLRVRVTACRATTLRVTLRRTGRSGGPDLSRTVRVPAGTGTVSVTLPRRLPRGRYVVRVRMAGATLSFIRTLPAAGARR